MASINRRVEHLERVAGSHNEVPHALVTIDCQSAGGTELALAGARARNGANWGPAVVVPPKQLAE